jgi:hypothetical protein
MPSSPEAWGGGGKYRPRGKIFEKREGKMWEMEKKTGD